MKFHSKKNRNTTEISKPSHFKRGWEILREIHNRIGRGRSQFGQRVSCHIGLTPNPTEITTTKLHETKTLKHFMLYSNFCPIFSSVKLLFVTLIPNSNKHYKELSKLANKRATICTNLRQVIRFDKSDSLRKPNSEHVLHRFLFIVITVQKG